MTIGLDLESKKEGPSGVAFTLTALSKVLYNYNKDVGWWKGWGDHENIDNFIVGTKISLAHSELSEALEGYRKNLMDDHLPEHKMVGVELADAMIRILDLAGALEIDIGRVLVEKVYYNRERADHKQENREKTNGKKF